jgi:hypothetical protein
MVQAVSGSDRWKELREAGEEQVSSQGHSSEIAAGERCYCGYEMF